MVGPSRRCGPRTTKTTAAPIDRTTPEPGAKTPLASGPRAGVACLPRARQVRDCSSLGLCHVVETGLARLSVYRDGDINDDCPFLLGHESAGRVAVIGEDVTHVEVGDYVVLNWRAVCGQCRACRKGVQQYCFDTHNASKPMTLTDGTELTAALG